MSPIWKALITARTTTGRFTPDAKREANRDGAPQIELIDDLIGTQRLFWVKCGTKVESRCASCNTINPDDAKRLGRVRVAARWLPGAYFFGVEAAMICSVRSMASLV